MAKKRGFKGTFGDLRFAVTRRYQTPASRSRLLLIGGGVVALVLLIIAADYFFRGGGLLSNGPVSSNHAAFESDCAACHDPELGVTNDNCSICHEKLGDRLGVFTFASHYVYRSDDFRRVATSGHELPCFACHTEHEGRQAEITRVPDLRCEGCHYESFGEDHPEFQHAREGSDDSSALSFTHISHVREIMQRQELEDVERACLYCHNAEDDGRGFRPIDFDRHCDSCHLTTGVGTPRLPIGDPGDPAAPGVRTLAQIRAEGGPGTLWSFYTNPSEFVQAGPRVMKRPLHHRDPWILHNLRSLRKTLYPDAGLADLLTTSAEVDAAGARDLYEEAIDTLEQYALELRAAPQPEIQADLERIDALLEQMRRDLNDPYTPLDESKFVLALTSPDSSEGEGGEVVALAEQLTQPCRLCHAVAGATLSRVPKDQGRLARAEFDHRAHIVQRRCLDCHTQIPILEHIGSTETVSAELDRAQILNLPGIGSCRECHTKDLASSRCVTCHLFHPQSRRSELLLYLN